MGGVLKVTGAMEPSGVCVCVCSDMMNPWCYGWDVCFHQMKCVFYIFL